MRLIDAGLREGHEYTVRDTWLTLPNVITLARFALVPVFVWFTATGRHLEAFVVLTVLSGSDWVDGWIARRFDMISTVGRWLDPLADRLALLTVASTVVATGLAPLWFALVLVVSDVLLAAWSWHLFRGSPRLKVTVLGKVRTAVLLVATPVLLLAHVPHMDHAVWSTAATVLLAAGAVLHAAAALDYARRCRRLASQLRARGVDPRDRAAWAD